MLDLVVQPLVSIKGILEQDLRLLQEARLND